MISDMDKIKFQSRREIDETMAALDIFLNEHPKADEKKTVTRLRDLLDVMYMEW